MNRNHTYGVPGAPEALWASMGHFCGTSESLCGTYGAPFGTSETLLGTYGAPLEDIFGPFWT